MACCPCKAEYGVLLAAPPRGSHELAAVLAAVAVGGGLETSRTCSTLLSVSSSFEGVIETSGSKAGGSTEVVSSILEGGSAVGSGSGSAGLLSSGSGIDAAGVLKLLAKSGRKLGTEAYFWAEAGSFFGGGGAANMLAQLFFTPVGIMVDAAAAVVDTTSDAAAPHVSAGLVVVVVGCVAHESVAS